MSLWGATTTDESKPKHLTDAEKRDVYATKQGWVKRTTGTGGRAGRVHEETLVAIGDLHGGDSAVEGLGAGTISAVSFGTTELTAAGGPFQVKVHFNEQVTISTASPLMVLTNDQTGGGTSANFTLTMDGALPQTNNTFTFSTTIPGAGEVAVNDVLSVAAQTINNNGATVKDFGTTLDSSLVINAAAVSLTGTVTVGA